MARYFKYKSTASTIRPTRDDLTRTLEEGIPGTYMPSFVLLGPEKLGLIVDYIGIATNLRLHARILADTDFRAGGVDIHHLEAMLGRETAVRD